MARSDDQWEFLQALALLILWAKTQGYKLTGGDLWAKDGHIDGSFHYKRLAQDLNLFLWVQGGVKCKRCKKTVPGICKDEGWCKDCHRSPPSGPDISFEDCVLDKGIIDGRWVYQRSHEAHRPLGEFWKTISPKCTWGGDFRKKDSNHYSYLEK